MSARRRSTTASAPSGPYDARNNQNGPADAHWRLPDISVTSLRTLRLPPESWLQQHQTIPTLAAFRRRAVGNGGNSTTRDREVRRSRCSASSGRGLHQQQFPREASGQHRSMRSARTRRSSNENRSWQMYANSQEWDGWWNNTTAARIASGIASRLVSSTRFVGLNRASAAGSQHPRASPPTLPPRPTPSTR